MEENIREDTRPDEAERSRSTNLVRSEIKMRGRLALVSVHNSLEHDRMTKFTYVHPYALSHPLAI